MIPQLRRLLKRLLGVPELGPRSSVRECLFPDLNTNRDLGQLLGMFDPSNTSLYSRPLLRHRPEQLLIRKGSFEEAAARVKTILFLMNAEERLNYAFLTTNDLHELRHVHDYFGTVTGFNRFLRTIDDAFEFAKMWRSLVAQGIVKLPLKAWSQQEDAPAELRAYAEKRRAYIEWCHLVQGSMERLATPVDADTLVIYSFDGQPTAPAVSFDMKHLRSGRPLSYAIPFGMHAIMESVAFMLQRYAIRKVFGETYSRQATQALEGGSEKDTQWLYYTALEQLALKIFNTFYIENLLAVADLAMMPGRQATKDVDWHPGYRLLELMRAAKEVAPLDRHPDDLVETMDRLAAECGWEKPAVVVSQRIDSCRADLADAGTSVWDLIEDAAIRLHLHCLEIRQQYAAAWCEPLAYFPALKVLPWSPLWIEGKSVQLWGLNEADASMFGRWYAIQHFLQCVWFETSVPCAFGPDSHGCRGDALGAGWKPSDGCLFPEIAEQLFGLPPRLEILN